MPLPTINNALRDRMKASIMKVPFDATDTTPTDFFLLCRKAGCLEPDATLVSRNGVMDAPESCANGEKPRGLFFVQPLLNTDGGPHVIPRGMLKGLFVDDNYKFVCSGYAKKVINREPGGIMRITKEPKLLCMSPKDGVTKADVKKTIGNLDSIYLESSGFKSPLYMKVVNKTFDTNRWNL